MAASGSSRVYHPLLSADHRLPDVSQNIQDFGAGAVDGPNESLDSQLESYYSKQPGLSAVCSHKDSQLTEAHYLQPPSVSSNSVPATESLRKSIAIDPTQSSEKSSSGNQPTYPLGIASKAGEPPYPAPSASASQPTYPGDNDIERISWGLTIHHWGEQNPPQDVQYLGAGASDGRAPTNCLPPNSQLLRPGVPGVHYHPRFGFPPPNLEGEYLASRDFRHGIPRIPLLPIDIQGDRVAPYTSGSPASLQISTLEGSTGNKEEFKMVDEVWDKGTGGYKTVESPGSAEYPFVVRRRFGKPNTDPKCYIDIESEGLRAIVLQALENNASAYIGEEDITIDLGIPLNCLLQLEDHLATLSEHLKRLVKFLKPFQEINIPSTTHSEGMGESNFHMNLPALATHSKEDDMSPTTRLAEPVDLISMMSLAKVGMSLAEQEQPRNCSSSEKHDPQDLQPPSQCSLSEERRPPDSQLPEACYPQPPPLSSNPVVRTDQTGYSGFFCPLSNPKGDERAPVSYSPQLGAGAVDGHYSSSEPPDSQLAETHHPQPGIPEISESCSKQLGLSAAYPRYSKRLGSSQAPQATNAPQPGEFTQGFSFLGTDPQMRLSSQAPYVTNAPQSDMPTVGANVPRTDPHHSQWLGSSGSQLPLPDLEGEEGWVTVESLQGLNLEGHRGGEKNVASRGSFKIIDENWDPAVNENKPMESL
ncbi:MAG: hypothetical protein M1839_003070 [Geoglossum umbratile]|nr:MAG: hypothetical protein M1839_003070 [Geoglossum umbratile]